MGWFSKNAQRLKDLIVSYGWIAAAVWFTIFGLVLCGFAIAFKAGFEVEGAAATTGVWGAAYVATQLTKPLRIIATVVLTPIVARLIGVIAPIVSRLTGKASASASEE